MTDFVDELRNEHREIRRILDVLARELDVLEASGEPDWDLLKDTMYYLTRYPDLFHHACEDLVFRRLHQQDPESRSFVRDLTSEHSMLRELGLDFLDLCEDVSSGVVVPKARLESRGRRYLVAQLRHMRKEEETVFPRIREKLTAEDWTDVQEGLERMGSMRSGAEIIRTQFRALDAHLAPEEA